MNNNNRSFRGGGRGGGRGYGRGGGRGHGRGGGRGGGFGNNQRGNHHGNPFAHNNTNGQLNEKESKWGQVKFNPITARKAREEAATPWKKFKNELHQANDNSNEPDVTSEEAKSFMKKREQNYRRNLIEENRKQPTKWETFDDETKTSATNDNKRNQLSNIVQITDPNDMSFEQRNLVRKVITKTTNLSKKHSSLEFAVRQMQRDNEIYKEKKATKKQQFDATRTNPFTAKKRKMQND